MAALRALDVSASNKVRRSCGPQSTRSSSEARALNGAVDGISEHWTCELNHDFGDRGRHVDVSGASNQDQSSNKCGIIGSWPTIIAQSRLSIGLHRIGRLVIFARHFPYKIVFFPLYTQLLINREEIKQF